MICLQVDSVNRLVYVRMMYMMFNIRDDSRIHHTGVCSEVANAKGICKSLAFEIVCLHTLAIPNRGSEGFVVMACEKNGGHGR